MESFACFAKYAAHPSEKPGSLKAKILPLSDRDARLSQHPHEQPYPKRRPAQAGAHLFHRVGGNIGVRRGSRRGNRCARKFTDAA